MRLDIMMQELAVQAQQASSGQSSHSEHDPAAAYFDQASAPRINTEEYMINVLRQEYPDREITTVSLLPTSGVSALLVFADGTGRAKYTPCATNDSNQKPHTVKSYFPPARRINGPSAGSIQENIKFGKFDYQYMGVKYILVVCNGRDGASSYPPVMSQFLIHPDTNSSATQDITNDLIKDAGRWLSVLHNEIWVFDSGYWQKDAALYASIQKAHWKDVILDETEKAAIQDDARHFFDSRDRYDKLRVPWKRGVIYHGPPGNGKTISIKALMHELYNRQDPIPTMYVKSFQAFGGPEAAVKSIFTKARAEAPCLLVFEDLDSLVTDQVRSYFLNEVDGIAANEGVMMIGSTNHLDRLDPGLSKRPSRFDRKFLFPKPSFDERVAYCEYWRGKLSDNDEIEFPKKLSPEIARITDEFSFAYLQEAFVASLLAIAFEKDDEAYHECHKRQRDDFNNLVLWREIKKQVKILRDEI